MDRIGLLGFGSWGTALAVLLSSKGYPVDIFVRNKEKAEKAEKIRENKEYLPGVPLNDLISLSVDKEKVVRDKDILIFAVPTQKFREALLSSVEYVSDHAVIVNVAKGIEDGSLLLPSQIFDQSGLTNPFVALSGPSHAEEVGKAMPTGVVAASEDLEAAERIRDLFMTDRFRVYTNDDIRGVELGGALKNIMALGAGISDGIGFGDNAKAAMITRGLAEMSRLGKIMGAKPETFAGLSGLGDLVVTCTSHHSRNWRCGNLMGKGVSPEEAMKKIGMVVEGVYTCEAAYMLAEKMDVDMPITKGIYSCLKGEVSPHDAIYELMTRDPKFELFGE
jgi:glycerol-3-phosphate dehydrogenase (NAD(P)+)